MTNLQIASLAVGFLVTALLLRFLRPFAYRINLLDEPCSRKRHRSATPLLGGVCVFAGVMVALAMGVDVSDVNNDRRIVAFVSASTLMVFLGVVDDKYDVSAKARLVGQLIIAGLMIFVGQLHFESLGNLLGLGELSLGWLALPFTVLAVLAAINAFNMIDGIDGLLGGMALLSFVAIGSLSGLHGSVTIMYVAFVLAVALLPFLFANLGLVGSSRKVFMGDSGSMFIGLSIIWLLILTTQGHTSAPAIKPVTALWLVAVPVMDIVSVMLRRLRHGQSPIRAGRDHIHHYYLRAGFSPRTTLLSLLAMAFLMQVLGVLADINDVPDVALLIGFLLAYFAYLLHIKWLINKAENLEQRA